VSRGKILFLAGFAVALGAGWAGLPAVLYERSQQPVAFSHKVHTGEKGGMKCDDCHFREDGSFGGIPALEKCAGCHAAPLGQTPAEKAFVDGYVIPNREVPWGVYARQPENAYFPHTAHVKLAKLACSQCHGDHGSTDILRPLERDRITGYSRDLWGRPVSQVALRSGPGMLMDDCVACHRDKGLQHSCLDCHK
jgi:menaquinone reductase, multiheme cytochrome c subunit